MIVIKKFEKQNCYPCRVLDTYLNEYDFDSLGVKLEKVDVTALTDEELAKLKIRRKDIPVLIFYRNDHEMARLVGLKSMDEFEDCLRQAKEGR
jgi:thiol:disulfide interchange protein